MKRFSLVFHVHVQLLASCSFAAQNDNLIGEVCEHVSDTRYGGATLKLGAMFMRRPSRRLGDKAW